MSGKNPKEGVGYELSVATLLKISMFSDSSGSALDLMHHVFNIKPRKSSAIDTNTGFPIELDITASSDEVKFHIECKKTNDPTRIMHTYSDEFCKTLREFLGIEYKVVDNDVSHRYLLVTNLNLSRDIHTLLEERSIQSVRKFKKTMTNYLMASLGNDFKNAVVSEKNIKKTLAKMRILIISYAEIRAHRDDKVFNDQLAKFASKLNPSVKVIFGPNGPEILSNQKEIVFNCANRVNHDKCAELVVEGIKCHFGDFLTMEKKLAISQYKSYPYFVKINCKELGYGPKNLIKGGLGIERATNLLTQGLNQLLHKEQFGVLFIKGTLDLIIFEKNKLARTIKQSIDANGTYDLELIPSFKGMGLIKRELSKTALSSAYGFETNDEDYLVSEDIFTHN